MSIGHPYGDDDAKGNDLNSATARATPTARATVGWLTH